jgi:ABC-type Mn2+/Zn2+ transport system ATPase subunit
MYSVEAVRAESVWFSYGPPEPIIQEVSVSIPQGSIAAIIGPNGCGKTTLLRLLLGLLTPQQGFVRILGKSPAYARAEIAYVPQRFAFDKTFPITVREFLQLSHPQASPQKIDEYLRHLNIAETLHMKLGALSGGQLQRVLIGRATLGDPKVLFLDEPSAGIDIAGEQTFFELVLHLHREHRCTVVMVSHELDVVASYADLVICLNRRLVCQGTPDQVLTPRTLTELYGKNAGLYRHRHSER